MRPRSFWRRFSKVILIIILTIVVCAIVWFLLQLFVVRKIEIISENLAISIDEKRFPRNLILFPAKQVEEQILRDNPGVETVKIGKKFPDTLIIILTPRSAVARLVSGNQEFVLASDGQVVNSNQINLPTIQIDIGQIHLSEPITDPRVKASLQFLELTQKSQLQIISISVYDNQSLVAKLNQMEILFAQSDDLKTTIATLQSLLAGFKIKGSMPTRIDLRFDKPVVFFSL